MLSFLYNILLYSIIINIFLNFLNINTIFQNYLFGEKQSIWNIAVLYFQ